MKYKKRGFGVAEEVNRGKVWDVDWGPRVGPVDLQPLGGERTVACTWQVQFRLPTCPDAVYKNAVREFCFSLDYAIDRAGLTTRTYKAHVSIAVTRKAADSREIPDTADRLLEEITPPPLLGYERISQDRAISEDKSVLNLTVVDKQFPAFAPPPGCVSAKLRHSYDTIPPGTVKWSGTFTGTYEVAKSATTGADTARTVQDFLSRVDDRLDEVGRMISDGKPLGRAGVIPTSIRVAEPDAYANRQIEITLTYMIAGVGLADILNNGGLWKPWGTQYNHWEALTPTLHHPRGEAKLIFSAKDDRIVDLCGPADPKGPTRRPGEHAGGDFGDPPASPASLLGLMRKVFPPPTPERSWVDYQSQVSVQADTGRVVSKTLPIADGLASLTQSGGAHWDALQGHTTAVPGRSAFPPLQDQLRPSQTAGETVVHQRTKPTLWFRFTGSAVRVGFPVPMPELVQVNGEAVTLVGKAAFASGIVANVHVPVYGARWDLSYVATGDRAAAGPNPTPPNSYLA